MSGPCKQRTARQRDAAPPAAGRRRARGREGAAPAPPPAGSARARPACRRVPVEAYGREVTSRHNIGCRAA
eukprot:1065094-Prymnesium_polylepis.1